MSQINTSPVRIGNFTSSGIVALTTSDRSGKCFGAPAMTYIAETNYERMLGRNIDSETNARATTWGTMVEAIVFELLPTDYTFSSQLTDTHPIIPYWRGSKDGTKECAERAVIDIKSPFTLKSFVQLVLPLYCGLEGIEAMNAIRNGFKYNEFEYPKHKDGDKFYWQLVSNAIINGCDYAELVVFCPYKSELMEIYKLAEGNPEMKWLAYASENELPALPDGGTFKNLNIISFKIPQADKDFLTERVLAAGELLIHPMQMEHTFDVQAIKEPNISQ